MEFVRENWCQSEGEQQEDFVISMYRESGDDESPDICVPCSAFSSSEDFVSICNEYSSRENATIVVEDLEWPPFVDPCQVFGSSAADGLMIEGKCQLLTMRGSCPYGYWLVYDEGTPKCRERTCSFLQVEFEGKCQQLFSSYPCGNNGQYLITGVNGRGKCHCDVEINSSEDQCPEIGKRGPCPENSEIAKAADRTAVCIPNFCARETEIFVGQTSEKTKLNTTDYETFLEKVREACFRKRYLKVCPAQYWRLYFDEEKQTYEVSCHFTSSTSYYNVIGNLPCPKGYKSDRYSCIEEKPAKIFMNRSVLKKLP